MQRNNPRVTQLTAVGINIPNITESLVQAPLKTPDLAVLFKKRTAGSELWTLHVCLCACLQPSGLPALP